MFMKSEYLKITAEYNQINAKLSSGELVDFAKLGKRLNELKPVFDKIEHLEILEQMATDSKISAEDKQSFSEEAQKIQGEIDELLMPKDPNDDKDCIVEIRAGAGGDEATLFAAEMFRALGKFAEENGFKPHIVSSSRSEAGGFKEVIFEIHGKPLAGNCPYSIFKYESGVHRVQRVPDTEKSGRVHTSTITVAVLPILEEKDFAIDPKDLKIEATTSSGHGGQSVNTTYSAIRITHIPTGITAQCQDERSQAQNREKALSVIRARVAAHFAEIESKKIRDLTKSQIGTGDRSEKVRTYNFPQDRVTDHRINENFNQINLIMEGKFSPIISALQKADVELKKEALKA
ncbi:MAG: PCRF domain-containing protein [Candidatus Doudnabacteria bacterium]|nr:PCRF domain-containing protein [Candidatus Doudnabacteria bacterium]